MLSRERHTKRLHSFSLSFPRFCLIYNFSIDWSLVPFSFFPFCAAFGMANEGLVDNKKKVRKSFDKYYMYKKLFKILKFQYFYFYFILYCLIVTGKRTFVDFDSPVIVIYDWNNRRTKPNGDLTQWTRQTQKVKNNC